MKCKCRSETHGHEAGKVSSDNGPRCIRDRLIWPFRRQPRQHFAKLALLWAVAHDKNRLRMMPSFASRSLSSNRVVPLLHAAL